MLKRSAPDAPPTLALTATKIGVLDRLVNHKPKANALAVSDQDRPARRLSAAWRGLSRLTDIARGAMVGGESVGN